MPTTLPRNIRRWEFIAQTDTEIVLCCRDCGEIDTFGKSALDADYIVCAQCGA